ncbi:MAG TPA: hypothetical protein VME20_11870 [Acidimicrobiales bacterium]|nr:hypothetical protein [Acidimicrobiales bacterium]
MTGTESITRSTKRSSIEAALDQGKGILRLAPTWVPRSFCVPGRRIKLHPDDYFALGGERGGIDERWFSSTIRADNGPLTGPDEGLSFVVGPEEERLPFDEVVAELGADLIGERLWAEHGGWTMYSKFFDNEGPLPFHLHQTDEKASLVGRVGKPEAYYFSPQMNNHVGTTPVTYFGLIPGTTKEEFKERLAGFGVMGDNRITELSLAYRIQLGTGWDVPAGVLHAPASVCTYEPQRASDVLAMCECWTCSRTISDDLLWKDVPEKHRGDWDFAVSLVDWEKNTSPDFFRSRFSPPVAVADRSEGCEENWVVYRSRWFSAKELTVHPGARALVRDSAAYGCIVVQGRGSLGGWALECPTLIRYGQLTADEFFVSEEAARQGVWVKNESDTEPLVMLKHFGPGNPDNNLAEQA